MKYQAYGTIRLSFSYFSIYFDILSFDLRERRFDLIETLENVSRPLMSII